VKQLFLHGSQVKQLGAAVVLEMVFFFCFAFLCGSDVCRSISKRFFFSGNFDDKENLVLLWLVQFCHRVTEIYALLGNFVVYHSEIYGLLLCSYICIRYVNM